MLAKVEQTDDGVIVTFERYHRHSCGQVWSYLTENDKLQQWFAELSVEDLRKGGLIKFDMQDGTFEEMEIFDYERGRVLEFAWGEDQVRFELTSIEDGCRLMLTETLSAVTAHTPKDIAGWHVCLDAIEALLDGRQVENEWEPRFAEYSRVFEALR